MTAQTIKVAKRKESTKKAYKFEKSDPVTILSFLSQPKEPWSSNGVSNGKALYFPAFSIAKSLAVPFTFHMTLKNEHRDWMDGLCAVERQKSIYAYLGAASYLLKSYANDETIVK